MPDKATSRWVRYVMPLMVEVDCDTDEITRVVQLPTEIREDRDDLGHFCFYDEEFTRQPSDEQPQNHALWVAQPRWDEYRIEPPVNWPKMSAWEEGFDLTEADDKYEEIRPYGWPGEEW